MPCGRVGVDHARLDWRRHRRRIGTLAPHKGAGTDAACGTRVDWAACLGGGSSPGRKARSTTRSPPHAPGRPGRVPAACGCVRLRAAACGCGAAAAQAYGSGLWCLRPLVEGGVVSIAVVSMAVVSGRGPAAL
jgi:hypothetical protein